MELTTTNLPDLGPDQTSCGMPVDYFLSMPTQYDSYLWSDGSTGTELYVTSPGTYYVTVNNACITNAVDSITINEVYYPTLDLGQDIVACGGTNVTLTTGFDYDLVQWMNAADSSIFNTDTTITLDTNMYIMLRVRESTCPAMIDWINISFTTPYDQNEICIATVDTNGLNKIVWDPTYTAGIESYNIYKYSGTNVIQVENVLLDSIISWGQTQFWDTTTNSQTQATAYAVTAIDTCGNESTLSASHQTVWTYTTAASGGTLLHRSDYVVSDGSFVVDNYIVLIDSFANGNLNQIDVFNPGVQDYLITNPYPGANYYAGAGLPYTCTGNKSVNDLSGISVSNPIMVTTVGINRQNNVNLNVSIYPNPSTGIFQIRSDKKIEKIEILNNIGQIIMSTNSTTIDLSSYTKGVYIAKVYTIYGPSIQKIILK